MRGPARKPAARTVSGVLPALLALLLSACGAGDGAAPAGDGRHATVTVLAAASLTEAFTTIGADFEKTHPGTRVRFDFRGSSALAGSIRQGAPADVFASADERNMKTVTDAGRADGAPEVFALNTLRIAVEPGNPKGITSLADLARPGTKVAVCAPQVPCGAAAETVLDAAGVTLTPATYEKDVKAAMTKLTLGEVDAALVYRTDVTAAGDKALGVDFPEAPRAVNAYPVVVLTGAPQAGAAREFVAHVRSDAGRAVLTDAGFGTP